MTKRNALNNLNQDNWDEDDEPEEQGQFIQASKEQLDKRVIKVAKRANPNKGVSAGLFSGFSGFASTNTGSNINVNSIADKGFSTTTTPMFASSSNTSGLAGGSSRVSSGFPTNGLKSALAAGADNKISFVAGGAPSSSDLCNQRPPEYFSNLKVLNKTVCDWINLHVEKSPCCVLTPVFTDYAKFMAELKVKYPPAPVATKGGGDEMDAAGPEPASDCPMPTFVNPTPVSDKPSTESLAGGFPGVKKPSDGSTASSAPKSTLIDFSKPSTLFGTSLPSSNTLLFATAARAPAATSAEDEPYEPPQPDIVAVEEKNAFHSVKCKLFYKSENQYIDRGIAMLHLKKTDDDKTQLIIRADTNLGNLFLNIVVNQDVKTQRNKNSVIIICVPNPAIKNLPAGPATMLIRVKSEAAAEELLKLIDDGAQEK